jgi:hypothetical protein
MIILNTICQSRSAGADIGGSENKSENKNNREAIASERSQKWLTRNQK